jgi:hypothetical protein
MAFSNMSGVTKGITQAIRDNKPTDMYPDLYKVVKDIVGFTKESLMAALSHLINRPKVLAFSVWYNHIGSSRSGPRWPSTTTLGRPVDSLGIGWGSMHGDYGDGNDMMMYIFVVARLLKLLRVCIFFMR